MSENLYRLEFDKMDWESPAVGVRFKQLVRGAHRVRLVEFTDQFEEAQWCRIGHIGWVIEGELEITFDDHTEQLKAGDGLIIPPGDDAMHKARVPRGKVVLFLVENADN